MQFDQQGETQKVEIYVSCRGLIDTDLLSKSDPYVKLKVKNFMTNQFQKAGKTEKIKNSIDPDFCKSFLLDYYFEFRQECIFEVFDKDKGGKKECLGRLHTSIGEIVGAKDQILIKDLQNTKRGKIILRCENVQENEDNFRMDIYGQNLRDMSGCCGRKKVKLRFNRIKDQNQSQTVLQTKECDIRNASWNQIKGSVRKLCNGDIRAPIGLDVVQGETIIGQCYINLGQFMNSNQGNQKLIIKDADGQSVGNLFVENYYYEKNPTFLQFIRGGVQLNLQVAIDFTGSNGDYSHFRSLHHLSSHQNQYQQALQAVSEILIDYDYDKKIPCYGFGASVNGSGTKHCFPLNSDNNDPSVLGVEGIMNVYKQILPKLDFSGPTYFNYFLKNIVNGIKQQNDPNVYTILLVLTDGAIHDMELTMNQLTQGSSQPLSVIIVGVGDADFQEMEILDGDSGEFLKYGYRPERDITQFIDFRNVQRDKTKLAKKVLKEVPSQLKKYYKLKNIIPQQIKKVNIGQILKSNFKQTQLPPINPMK